MNKLKEITKASWLAMIIFHCVILYACDTNTNQATKESLEFTAQKPKIKVNVEKAVKKDFFKSMKVQGQLYSKQDIAISWQNTGVVKNVYVDNGQYVEEGQLIAELESSKYEYAIQLLELDLEKAELNFEDLKIKAGIDSTNIESQDERLRVLDIQSGRARIKVELDNARKKLEFCKLFAPCNGVIYEMQVQPFMEINNNSVCCNILNLDKIELSFHIMESDAAGISKGQKISFQAISFTDASYNARVSAIIPQVNLNGLVKVIAQPLQRPKKLFDKMKVELSIRQKIPRQIVVPKEALVLRSGKEVVFIFDKQTSKSKWKYVTVGPQNEKELVILEGLNSDDLVIVKGNLNLSHDTAVVLDEN